MLKKVIFNKNNLYFVLIIIVGCFVRYYNFDKYGYWLDEYWGTFYLSNPELTFSGLKERIFDFGKFQHGMPEPTPIYYYYFLNIFFDNFGYTAQNGRIFSIIFSSMSLIFFFLISKIITSNFNSFVSLILITFNIFLIWEAQEARVQSFNLFLVSINLYIFCYLYFQKMTISVSTIYIISNFLMLSVHPLTGPIILANSIFLLIKRNKKSIKILSLIFISAILYLIGNFEYLVERINVEEFVHHAKISHSFFYSYHFKTFFGNVYFGALNLFLILILIISAGFQLIKNKRLFYLTLLIIITYVSLLVISIIFQPVMHPRYKIYIIPIILIWVSMTMNYLKIKNLKFIIYFYIILTIGNYFIFYEDRHLKKPNINEPLKLVLQSDTKKLYLVDYIHSGHYFQYFKREKIILNSNIDLLEQNQINHEKFWVLCVDDVASFSLQTIKGNRLQSNCFPKFLNIKNYKLLETNEFERTRLNLFVQNEKQNNL